MADSNRKATKNGKWHNPQEKFSHEGKPLARHVDEVKEIACRLLQHHKLNEDWRKVSEYFADYHDYGKLQPEWDLKNKRKPPHSPASVAYLAKSKIFLPDEFVRLTPLAWYLILKHHSVLGKNVSLQGKAAEVVDTVKILIPLLRTVDFAEKLDLVDTFGLFKIADSLSARDDAKFQPLSPESDKQRIKAYFAKNEFDEDRWKQQLNLADAPDFSLLGAYTGWGKTMASPLFLSGKSVPRAFFLFPTITAINQFHERLSDLEPRKVSRYFYLYDPTIDDNMDTDGTYFLARNFLSPYMITSIDQFLLSFLQAGKYYSKRVMFRGAGIILDEIHTLNPMMMLLVTYFLKRFRRIYNLKFLGMSATLTDAVRAYFTEQLELPTEACLLFDQELRERRRVMFRYHDSSDIDTARNQAEVMSKEKNVMIATNTVDKAIEIGRSLIDGMKLPNVVILHGRFMYRDRAKKEDDIKAFDMTRKPHILVCTQVCEVSLDVSYDHLFTELAPLPSLIQRFGRVNRRERRTDTVNVDVYCPTIKDPSNYPYTPQALNTAKSVVSALREQNLSDEMRLLSELNQHYTRETLENEMDDARGHVSLDAFEDLLQFFFSLTIDETDLRDILSYRDGFNVAILPHYDCVSSEDSENRTLKVELKTILEADMKVMDFKERMKLFNKAKQLAVQVPFWWVKESEIRQFRLFPVVRLAKRIYSSKYGFHEE